MSYQRAHPSAHDLDLIKQKSTLSASVQKIKYWLKQGKSALKFAQQLPGYDMGVADQRKIKIIPFSLPQKTAQTLLAACRARGTTIHGALGAAQVLAINREFDHAEQRNMALNSLADLRGVLSDNLTEHDMGLYVATLTTVHSIAAAPDFWQLAVDIRNQLTQILQSGDADLVHSIYREDSLFPPSKAGARMVQAVVALAPPASMLTNIGRLEPVALGNGAGIRSIAFAVSPPAQNPVCVTVASYAARMDLNLIYDQHKLSDSQAQRIVQSLLGFVEAAAAG